jgi:shikimate dehydrogenase
MIGDPVEHSLSPSFQQPAFDYYNLQIRYELWLTRASEFSERMERIRSGNALGANVTVPHKETAFTAVDDRSTVAQRIGAVNTVVVRQGRLFGDNTDVHGFIVPLKEQQVPFGDLHAVIIGAGGAARGAAVALLDAGVSRLTIVNRSPARAERLVADLSDVRLRADALARIESITGDAGLIVNATALGWSGSESPIDASAMSVLPRGAIAYDLTYRETPFLRLARAAGLATIDGLPMLVHQGARSFELWTGRDAPLDLMWRAAVAARAARGG